MKNYHHGNLRAELLDTAVEELRESGAEALSLRALARAVGPFAACLLYWRLGSATAYYIGAAALIL